MEVLKFLLLFTCLPSNTAAPLERVGLRGSKSNKTQQNHNGSDLAQVQPLSLWRKYQSVNCYNGRGAVELSTYNNMAVYECKWACERTGGCNAVVMSGTTCYLRHVLDYGSCDGWGGCNHEGCERLDRFETYLMDFQLKASNFAATPTSSGTEAPLENHSIIDLTQVQPLSLWRKYQSVNCYNGRGAVELSTYNNMAVYECKWACERTGGCNAVVMSGTTCYLRHVLDYGSCDGWGGCNHEGCERLDRFETYLMDFQLKASNFAATPTSSGTEAPLENHSSSAVEPAMILP